MAFLVAGVGAVAVEVILWPLHAVVDCSSDNHRYKECGQNRGGEDDVSAHSAEGKDDEEQGEQNVVGHFAWVSLVGFGSALARRLGCLSISVASAQPSS